MKKLKSVLLFDDGKIAVFDDLGQHPALQENLITEWARRAEIRGYDVDGQIVETPRGNWKLLKTKDGFNLERYWPAPPPL